MFFDFSLEVFSHIVAVLAVKYPLMKDRVCIIPLWVSSGPELPGLKNDADMLEQ